jgi:hypothetical protein
MPRFTQTQRPANLQVVGTSYSTVGALPSSMLSLASDGTLTFETLYSFTGPAGSVTLAQYPGSSGTLHAAGRR